MLIYDIIRNSNKIILLYISIYTKIEIKCTLKIKYGGYETHGKTYLDSETAKNYGKGADWVCAYCGSYNRYNSSICKRCGAQKSSSEENPYGGRVYFSQEELKGYKQEIDHYETVSHQVAKEVFDHYEYEYSDNGDGTFTENRIPKYRTVYETVYKKVPIYVNVPKYDINYHYEIGK